MSILSENLIKARKKVKLSQEKVADILRKKYNLKVERAMISKWENDFQTPMIYNLKCLAEIYCCSLDDLNGDIELETNKQEIDVTPITSLPILGSVAAGTGTYTDNDIIGYEEIPSSWVNSNEQYVVLIVDGDSMYPKFEDGDHVLVRVQSSVDSGDYGIVLIDGDSAVIKKITYGDDWIELVSVNPMYPPRRFENEDVLNVRVFGLVKKSWRCY